MNSIRQTLCNGRYITSIILCYFYHSMWTSKTSLYLPVNHSSPVLLSFLFIQSETHQFARSKKKIQIPRPLAVSKFLNDTAPSSQLRVVYDPYRKLLPQLAGTPLFYITKTDARNCMSVVICLIALTAPSIKLTHNFVPFIPYRKRFSKFAGTLLFYLTTEVHGASWHLWVMSGARYEEVMSDQSACSLGSLSNPAASWKSDVNDNVNDTAPSSQLRVVYDPYRKLLPQLAGTPLFYITKTDARNCMSVVICLIALTAPSIKLTHNFVPFIPYRKRFSKFAGTLLFYLTTEVHGASRHLWVMSGARYEEVMSDQSACSLGSLSNPAASCKSDVNGMQFKKARSVLFRTVSV